MYSGNVSPCIEVNLTRDFKGEKTPLHVIIYKTYVVVTPVRMFALPELEPFVAVRTATLEPVLDAVVVITFVAASLPSVVMLRLL